MPAQCRVFYPDTLGRTSPKKNLARLECAAKGGQDPKEAGALCKLVSEECPALQLKGQPLPSSKTRGLHACCQRLWSRQRALLSCIGLMCIGKYGEDSSDDYTVTAHTTRDAQGMICRGVAWVWVLEKGLWKASVARFYLTAVNSQNRCSVSAAAVARALKQWAWTLRSCGCPWACRMTSSKPLSMVPLTCVCTRARSVYRAVDMARSAVTVPVHHEVYPRRLYFDVLAHLLDVPPSVTVSSYQTLPTV